MTTIGIVGLGEAGNLGDDLILIATAEALARNGVETIHHLSFGAHLPWQDLAQKLPQRSTVVGHQPRRDIPGSGRRQATFSQCAGVIIGGGGLIQSVHHPYRPFHWLSYLPTHPGTEVLAIGLGLGPVSQEWRDWFASRQMPFTTAILRDLASLKLARETFHWNAQLGRDFVTPQFLTRLFGEPEAESKERVLGVAIRAWSGLNERDLAAHIDSIAHRHHAEHVRFYVLEARDGSGIDVSFSRKVASLLRASADIRAYEPANMVDFIADMRQCEAAITMKLHASVVWHWARTIIYPIHYAPKTAALFGDSYNGLEIIQTPRNIGPEPLGVLDTNDAIADWLASLGGTIYGKPERYVIGRAERLKFQVGSTMVDIKRRIQR